MIEIQKLKITVIPEFRKNEKVECQMVENRKDRIYKKKELSDSKD